MKLSISNIAWSKDNDEDIYSFISQQNYSAIEIAPTRIIQENPYGNVSTGKIFSQNLNKKYNLDICSMQSILFGKTESLFGINKEREELLNYIKKAIDFASNINCKNLVFGSPKNRIIANDKQYPIAINFFNELGNFAAQNNTTISIEANPIIYGTNFINTTKQAFQLVQDVNSKGFKVNVDLGTIIQNDENIDQIIDNIDLINHIHISEPNLELIKNRKLHKDLSKKLKKTNYDKYVSIEMKLQKNIDDIKKTIIYIKEVFNDN